MGGGVGRCGEAWGDVGRRGEMWGDVIAAYISTKFLLARASVDRRTRLAFCASNMAVTPNARMVEMPCNVSAKCVKMGDLDVASMRLISRTALDRGKGCAGRSAKAMGGEGWRGARWGEMVRYGERWEER